MLADLQAMPPDEADALLPALGPMPTDWHHGRMMGTFRLAAGQQWLELRTPQARETLRRRLARLLHDLGLVDFDLGDALTRDRRLTQALSRWAHERGYHGIAYTSRFDHSFDCWAIFEGASLIPLDTRALAPDDGDLLAAAQSLGLRLN